MKKTILHSLFVFLISAMLSACSSPKPELHIYSWGDYIKLELIELFEKEHNCKVIVDTYDSNESMYARLKAGAKGYDLLYPSNYIFNVMHAQGMVQKLNLELIPNVKHLDPQYARFLNDVPLDYAVPYMFTYAGIAYRKDKVKDVQPSWAMFERIDLKGRMTMLNDLREVMSAALGHLGYSVNTKSEKEIAEATALAILWKQNLAKFESEQYKNGIASAEYLLVQGYSGDIMQVIKENKNVAFLLPERGLSFSFDSMVIPKDAKQVELAHAFINFLHDPEIASMNMAFTMLICPNSAAYALLSPELRANPVLFPPPDVLDKSELIKDMGEDIELYYKAWDAIKAAKS